MKNCQEAIEKINNLKLGEGNWKTFLRIQSSFLGYSNNNKLVILAQNPDATMVAKFAYWKKMGRSVKKGETALRIFAPIIKKDEMGKEDLKGFMLVPVFDVSQTEGAPLPELGIDLSKTYSEIIEGIENLTETPLVFESDSKLKKAILDDSGLVVLPDRGSDEKNVQNVVKGYVRYLLSKEKTILDYPEAEEAEFHEIISESVNYIVSNTFGFKETEYDLSPKYLEKDALLKKISPVISKMAGIIINMVYEGLKTEEETATA